MNRRVLSRIIGVVTVLALGWLPLPAWADANGDDQTISVTIPAPRATLRWGINAESTSGAYAGECNFLSAGLAGDQGSSALWSEGSGLYQSAVGNVSIMKPNAAGAWEQGQWQTRCLDRTGQQVSVASTTSYTQSEIVFSDGRVKTTDLTTTIQWTGSFTAVMYGGLTYWSATDPSLTVDANGVAVLSAAISGYGTSREDGGQWVALAPAQVTLATFTQFSLGPTGGSGTPDYLGVPISGPDIAQTPFREQDAAYWGSFPSSFVNYQVQTGQGSYWYTSGGARDAAKPPLPVAVYFGAAADKAPVPAQLPAYNPPQTVVTGTGNGFLAPSTQGLWNTGGGAAPFAMSEQNAGDIFPGTSTAETLWGARNLVPRADGSDNGVFGTWQWWVATGFLLIASSCLVVVGRKLRNPISSAPIKSEGSIAGIEGAS